MPIPVQSTETLNLPKIRRTQTGCKSCRRRGKRCDQTKPCCQACARLSLDCTYGIDFSFRNLNGASFQQQLTTAKNTSPRPVTDSKPSTLSVASGTNEIAFPFRSLGGFSSAKIPMTPSSEDIHEAGYFNHFHRHVRHLLPAASLRFTEGHLQPLCLRFAKLCISASNLSMLDARVQSCISAIDRRKSIFSPLVNALHHRHAQNYQDLALWHFRNAHLDDVKRQAPAFLVALVLIALYHHASTNHLRFRLAVMDSVRFVLMYRTQIMDSAGGADSLQM
ncbi:unnamed protein product [Penicillium palitans]